MADSIKHQLKGALALMLKPLVRLLISQGVTHADFAESAKEVYVEVALRHFGEDDKINRSRVAVLTGLTRKEVKNVIDRTLASNEPAKKSSKIERVLTGWYSDPKFTGPYGLPLEIPYEAGDVEAASIVALVKAYGADMSAKQLLQELIASGCVVENGETYKAVRRMYEPAPLSAEVIDRLGNIGYWVFSTLASNMQKEKRRDFGNFERIVVADDGCTENVIVDFDRYIKERGQTLLEEIDMWFATNSKRNNESEQPKDTGFYMVHYIDDGVDRTTLKELLAERGVEQVD